MHRSHHPILCPTPTPIPTPTPTPTPEPHPFRILTCNAWYAYPQWPTVSLKVQFTDALNELTHRVTINWGDGETSMNFDTASTVARKEVEDDDPQAEFDAIIQEMTVLESPGSGIVQSAHTYSGPGTRTISVLITNEVGNFIRETCIV